MTNQNDFFINDKCNICNKKCKITAHDDVNNKYKLTNNKLELEINVSKRKCFISLDFNKNTILINGKHNAYDLISKFNSMWLILEKVCMEKDHGYIEYSNNISIKKDKNFKIDNVNIGLTTLTTDDYSFLKFENLNEIEIFNVKSEPIGKIRNIDFKKIFKDINKYISIL